jgi:acyl-CoA reductase-like NAD-dependent aldehyde dehydrogenase
MARRKTNVKRNGRAQAMRQRPRIAHEASNGNGEVESSAPPQQQQQRLPVLKTYKIFINGQFPRTESGRYYVAKSRSGDLLGNICRSSRKDFRDAVVAARNAQSSWASKTAYNRGQILYRIAEMLEGRGAQFRDELARAGVPASAGMIEVEKAIDRVLYYAGWCDKYQQVFSSVNPVATSHFNFSILEPTGVVTILAPQTSPLLGLISVIIPAIAGGNTCIALASTDQPLSAITFAEVLETSDLPAGVVNILTGYPDELIEQFASHMDVNACVYCGSDPKEIATVRTKASLNVKRVVVHDREDWTSEDAQSPYFILDTQEIKTTWHPVGT